jgi:hypothetical protein
VVAEVVSLATPSAKHAQPVQTVESAWQNVWYDLGCEPESVRGWPPAKQAEFVAHVKAAVDARARKLDGRVVGALMERFVLSQFGAMSDFAGWEALRSYRDDLVHWPVVARTSSPFLIDGAVLPIRGEAGSHAEITYEIHGASIANPTDALAPAVIRFFSFGGFLRFYTGWALWGWGRRARARRVALACAALGAVALGWLSLGAGSERSLWATLVVLVVAAFGMWAAGLGEAIREWARWPRLFGRGRSSGWHIIVAACHGRPNRGPVVDDQSYQLGIHLASIKAIVEHLAAVDGRCGAPETALEWCSDCLGQRFSGRAFTGSVSAAGRVGDVRDISQKLAACHAKGRRLVASSTQPIPDSEPLAALLERLVRRPASIVMAATGRFRGRHRLFGLVFLLCALAVTPAAWSAARLLFAPPNLFVIPEMTVLTRLPTDGIQEHDLVCLDAALGGRGSDCLFRFSSLDYEDRGATLPTNAQTLRLCLHPRPGARPDRNDGDVTIACPRTLLWTSLAPVMDHVPLRYLVELRPRRAVITPRRIEP